MKKLLLILFCLLFGSAAFAANITVTETRTFLWEYDIATIDNVDGWRIYHADVDVGPYIELISWEKTGDLSTSPDIVITGSSGATITKYYKMTAYNLIAESIMSDFASTDFLIPQSGVFDVIINFRIQVQ